MSTVSAADQKHRTDTKLRCAHAKTIHLQSPVYILTTDKAPLYSVSAVNVGQEQRADEHQPSAGCV